MSESPGASRLPGRRTVPAVVRLWTAWNPSPELIFTDCREREPEPRTPGPAEGKRGTRWWRSLGAVHVGLTGFEGGARGWLTR
jgi:hypothetical protein